MKSAQNVHSCTPICWAASWALPMRAATPVAIVNAAKNASVRSERSRAAANCARIRSQLGASGAPRRARNTQKSTAEAVWATTFAIAEPSIPKPRPTIRISERQIDPTLATAITTSGVTVSWNARSHPCPAATISTIGAPRAAIRIHSTACPAAAVSPPPSSSTAGRAVSSITTISANPSPAASQVACTPTSSASSCRPAPYSRTARAVVPYSRNVQKPKISDSSRPPSARPASGTVPRWPTIAVSPSTYSGSAISAPSAGTASSSTSRLVGMAVCTSES